MVVLTGKRCPKCGENSLFPYTIIDEKTEETYEAWVCGECHFEMERKKLSDIAIMEIRNKKAVRNADEWVWTGRQMHFVGDCNFHLATYVGDFLVSTIGEYYSKGSKKMETLGAWEKHFYETMVFRAKESPLNDIYPCFLVDLDAVDMEKYETAKEACERHLALCRKWGKREDRQK